MNWPLTFESRLQAWNQLRAQAAQLSTEKSLNLINTWWFSAPWRPYHLHWDDFETWPNPWELLSDNLYCDVAKGLGIMYTISLLDRADFADAALVLTQDGNNLVQVCQTKYILNWDKDAIVNINLTSSVKRKLVLNQLKTKYNL